MPETAAESRARTAIVLYFPMFIATLSLVTSIYNGYLNNRFLDFMQRNTGRTEYLRTCKEIIDGYFQLRMRVEAINTAGSAAGAAAQSEATLAVARFGALGTYLANLRDETMRAQYTQLTTLLDAIVKDAAKLSSQDLDRRYDEADREFTKMNTDCIRSAKNLPL
jgi:hypothetical protein